MSQQDSIGVFVIHQDRIWREAVIRSFARFRDIQVIGESDQQQQHDLAGQLVAQKPDVVLLDLDLPTRAGLTQARRLLQCRPSTRVLMIGIPNNDAEVIAAIEAGAAGYLTCDSSFDDLTSNIRALAAGKTLCSQRIARLLFTRVAKSAQLIKASRQPAAADIHLTPRELQIMTLIEEGLSNKGIARRLSIELQTVKNHVHNILVKLSLHRRTEVAHYVRQHGLSYQSSSTLSV